MRLPTHRVECHLTHYGPEHPHFEEEVADFAEDWIGDHDREAALTDREAWVLHWYPRNQVGSYVLAARTLNALLAYVENDVDTESELYA